MKYYCKQINAKDLKKGQTFKFSKEEKMVNYVFTVIENRGYDIVVKSNVIPRQMTIESTRKVMVQKD